MTEREIMTVHLAVKTMAAINEALERDQGALYRKFLQKCLPQCADAYRTEQDSFRSHMGASGIGKECDRAIWYSFRWHTKSKFDGRMVRLFNRGHLEEGRIIALLMMIGIEVWQHDAQGNQFSISGSHGHFGGSGDGVSRGIPDLPPGTVAILEFKTHSEKSFAKLKKEGVYEAKLEHYIQMTMYMSKMSIPAALYVAVNKNTDELYMEIVTLNASTAQLFEERADKIIWMKTPPTRVNSSPGSFKCMYCDHKPVCHLGAQPEKNCRSCVHSYPAAEKQWGCSLKNIGLTKEMQLAGCQDWKQIQEK